MAFLNAQTWYCGSTKYSAVAAWAALTSYAAGNIVRQLATPAVGSERVFVCTTAGTSGAAEPTWVITQGAKTTDGTITWVEITGKAGVNGSVAETTPWSTGLVVSIGVLIKDTVADTYFVCTTAGTTGATEPTWSKTAGATTTDNGTVWTSIGAVGNFASYAAPWARLYLALTGTPFANNGDKVYVSNNHAETQSTAISWTSGLSISIVCVNDTATPPSSLATTGSVSTTGASSMTIYPTIGSPSQSIYIYGMQFNCGSGNNGVTLQVGSNSMFLESCAFNIVSTATGSSMQCFGGNANCDQVQHTNCTFSFGNVSQSCFFPYGKCYVTGGSIAASGSVPTILLGAGSSGAGSELRIIDCDLSTIVGTLSNGASTVNNIVSFENCKLGAGVTYSSTMNRLAAVVKIHNSDSTNTNYNYWYGTGFGIAKSETSIIRSGGATNGTTALSWNCTSTSFATYGTPFQLEEIAQWNSITGTSKTATIQITTNTALTVNSCWLTLEYPSSVSYPLGASSSTRGSIINLSPAALTTSSSSWAGTAQTYKYQLQTTFTAAVAGVIKARIYIATPSLNMYVDPLIVVS